MKKMICLCMALILCVNLLAGVSFATETSGVFGDGFTWSFEDGVLVIEGSGAMQNFTSSTTPWNAYIRELEKVVISEGITSIGNWAFFGSTASEFVLPSSLVSIGDHAFDQCSNLTQITLPTSLESIGEQAFYFCRFLTEIEIPDSVKTLDAGVFYGCKRLASVKLPSALSTIPMEAFYGCSALAEIDLPDTLTAIQTGAFKNCSALREIVIPNSVTDLFGNAFQGCTALESVSLPSALKVLTGGVFYGCSALKTIALPNALETIQSSAFAKCSALEEIHLPASVNSVDDFAFINCSSLQKISVDEQNASYSSIDGHLYNKEKTILVRYAPAANDTVFAVPDTLEEIGTYACHGAVNLKRLILSDSTVLIGESAFYECAALESIEFGENLECIDDDAFSGCASLKSVVLPESLQVLGSCAFQGCLSMTSLVFLGCPTQIGMLAFDGCTSLCDVDIEAIDGFGTLMFSSCLAFESFVVPTHFEYINDRTFAYCENLSSIYLPKGLVSIGDQAFKGCMNLTDVYYAGSEEDRKKLQIDNFPVGNDTILNATWHYNSPAPEKQVLSMMNGAQIRTKGTQGLRFISTIQKGSKYSRVVEYGTLLIPTSDLTDISELVIDATLTGHKVAKVPAKYLYAETDRSVTFTAVITNIAEKNYAREYTARAYAILDDGSVIYADTGVSRSIYAVAKMGLGNMAESEENREVFQRIVDSVEQNG